MASQHLVQYIPHLLMFIMLLLAPILLLADTLHSIPLAPLGIIGLIPPLMYATSQLDTRSGDFRRLLAFPVLLLIGTGMIWNNSRAVLSGLVASHTEFRRTPKFQQQWTTSEYALRFDATILMEIALFLYALWGAWIAWRTEPALTPYLLIHAISFATVIIWDALDQWRIARAPLSQPRAIIESGND